MRIFTDPAFNNVVKSVPLCHFALDLFFKGQDHNLDTGGKHGWKKTDLFYRKGHKLKCLIGEEFLRVFPGKEMLIVDEMQNST